MTNNVELLNRGINSLLSSLGPVDTEQFIAFISRERFDYTKWQRNLFGDMTLEELNQKAANHEHLA